MKNLKQYGLVIIINLVILLHLKAQSFELARFPGCEDMLDKTEKDLCAKEVMAIYLTSEIEKSITTKMELASGKLLVGFTVDSLGEAKDVKIINGINEFIDSLVVQVYKDMNKRIVKWIPSRDHEGVKEQVYFTHLEINSHYEVKVIHAYTPNEDQNKVYKTVKTMPRFPGCEDMEGSDIEKEACSKRKMVRYIYENIKYPYEARKAGIGGTAVVQFTITEEGVLEDIKLLRDPGSKLGEAALELISGMNEMEERWIPGQRKGVYVSVVYTLPVKFRLGSYPEK